MDGDSEPEEIFFDTTKAGVQMEYLGLASIIDFIKTSLCGEELTELIVTESNRYYQKNSPY
jgi:hypothetical protein